MIIDLSATVFYTGTFTGTSTLHGTLILHANGTANFQDVETFTGTVNGVAGTLTFRLQGRTDEAGVITATDVIVSASGELAGLHGVLSEVATLGAEGPRRDLQRRHRHWLRLDRDGDAELTKQGERENAMTSTRKRWRTIVALLTVAGVVAVADAHATVVEGQDATRSFLALADTGTLTFQAEFTVTYPSTPCPAGTPARVECFARTGKGIVRGLGSVDETYAYLLQNGVEGCDIEAVRLLPTTARLTVPGKGEIELRVGGTACLARLGGVLQAKETFTITGGTGRYAGASGGGTIDHVSYGPPAFAGRDSWTGSLVVPGVNFDLTAPTITGAVNKTVRAPRRAKRVRVTYTVNAVDAVDGSVPISCKPASGSRFRIGRTLVRCSATDNSANTQTATFTVIVKARR